MRFDMRGVDHLRVSGPPAPSKRPKQVFPNAAPRPAYKAIIDRRRGAIFGRAITPAAAALKHMHDAADHAAIIYALDASYIPRQVKFDPLPLLIAQPKQVFAHDPNPLPKTNQDRIVRPKELMSFHPSYFFNPVITGLLLTSKYRGLLDGNGHNLATDADHRTE
jgi:hypothetical protein